MFLFKEGNTDVTTPMELSYMRKIRWRLTPIDIWPSKLLGDTEKGSLFLIPHKFLFCLWMLVLGTQLYYVKLNQGKLPFVVLGHTYITIMLNVVSWHRSTLMMTESYVEVVRTFIQEMHMVYKKSVDNYAMKTYKQVHKYCTIVSAVLFFQMWSGIILFNLTPLTINIWNGMFTLSGERPATMLPFIQSVYYWVPFDYTTWIPGLCIVSIISFAYGVYICTSCSMLDNLILIIVCHLWGHLKVLDYRLHHFPRPASEDMMCYSDEERPAVVERLKDLVIYHTQINSFANKISDAFGPVLAVYFSFHQICCCILLLECSQMDIIAIAQYGILTVFAFGMMILLSVSFEILGTMSEGVSDAVYSLPWECMGVPERRLVLVFLIKAQQPITLKALGLVPIGVKTMASIIKTSISYFIMLQTL